MQTNESSLIGTTLRNKYYVNDILNSEIQGGQGKIYFAQDITAAIEKKYLVKQFTPNYDETYLLETGKRLFKQEAKILQKLGSHSQIPQILDYFEENQQFFLVQEWIDGQNLKQELDSKQRLTEFETVALLKDVLEVLSFVHQNDCIHRDLKPANLIRNKCDRKIFLIDFGAVKEKIKPENIDEDGNSTLTIIIGTSGYMPAEQLRGMPEFGSDIYALGMIAIQALTGIHPTQLRFDSRHHNPLWRQHILTSDYPSGTLRDRNFNPHLLNVIDRMVRDSHKKRYQFADEVLKDMQQIYPHNFVNFSEPQNDSTIIRGVVLDYLQPKKSLLPWLGIGLVGLGTILAGIFALGNKPQYVAYDNANYGIELKRPENWSLREENDLLEPGVILLAPQENSQDNFREKVKISIEDLSTPLSLNEYTEQALVEIKNFNTVIEQPEDITFANREGRKIIYQGQDGKKRLEVWMIKNQKAYIATYTAESNKFDKYAKQANKIMQSLVINRFD